MIQKTIAMKIAAAVIGTAAIAGTVVAVRHMSEVKDTYRSILLYEIEGTAEIEREGTGKFNGTENLYLESGDQLTVEPESFTRLRLDEDKYVMVEENSAVSIEAAGTVEDSRTKLNLTRGAITNEIRNPLSAGSTYEVTTPNSIMAVREPYSGWKYFMMRMVRCLQKYRCLRAKSLPGLSIRTGPWKRSY